MIREFLMSDIFLYILLGVIVLTIGIKFFWIMSKPLRRDVNVATGEGEKNG
jgi:hypothetical protein